MQFGLFAEPTLVGRDEELEQLQVFLKEALQGKGKTVFISGMAGSGKTKLASKFIDQAQKSGVSVLSGWCLCNAAVPFFPFIEAFNHFFTPEKVGKNSTSDFDHLSPSGEKIGGEEFTAAELLKGPRGGTKPCESRNAQVWKDLTFAAVAKTLHSLSSEKPIVLFIDDLQWADSASLALLHYVSRIIGSDRILVVGTFRDDELSTDSEGRVHPLSDLLRLMNREGLLSEINLRGLSRANVGKVAQGLLGGKLDPRLMDKLVDESEGNPLFVVESVRMLVEHGCLFERDGSWNISIEELGVPSKIRDVVLRRIGFLNSSQRRVLDVASVIGEKFDVELLASALNQDTLDVMEILNTVSKSTLLILNQNNLYKFDHAKSREVLYEEVPSPLKRGYHARIAQRLEVQDSANLLLGELAYHYVQAGNLAKALKYSMLAGEDAISRFSNTEAAKHFKYVLDAVFDDPQYFKERSIALEGLGDAFFATGLFEDAIKNYEKLANLTDSGATKLRALRKVMISARWRGDVQYSLEIAKKAAEYASFDRVEYGRVLMNRGWALCLLASAKDGIVDMEESLKIFEEEYSLADLTSALGQAANFGAMLHEFPIEKSLGMSLRSIAIFKDLKDFRGQVEDYFFLGSIFSNCLLDEEAKTAYIRAIEIGEKIVDYNHLAWSHLYLSMLLENEGNCKDGISTALKGLEYADKTDAYYVKSMLLASLVRLRCKCDELESAKESYDEFVHLFEQVEKSGSKVAIAVGKRTLGVFSAASSNFDETVAQFEDALRTAKALNHTLFEAVFRKDYGWALSRLGHSEEAKIQCEEAENLLKGLKRDLGNFVLEADPIVRRKLVVGQEFEMRLDLINTSAEKGELVKINCLFLAGLSVVHPSPFGTAFQDGKFEVSDGVIEPFSAKSITITLQALKPGIFSWTPQVVYRGCSGADGKFDVKQLELAVSVEKADFGVPGRVSTGFKDFDSILLGGIPEGYALSLVASVSDERELLVRRFIKTGAERGEVTFYFSTNAESAKDLAAKFKDSFYFFLCNPRSDLMLENTPNTFKLKGVDNLTELDITLNKAFRGMSQSKGAKRACLEIVSDVLLQSHAVLTRKWLSGMLAELKSKGFTTLAVVDPSMHPQEEVQSITGLFDGEAKIIENETPEGTEKILSVRRLYNQRYLERNLKIVKSMLE